MKEQCDYEGCEHTGYFGNEDGLYCKKHWKKVRRYYKK